MALESAAAWEAKAAAGSQLASAAAADRAAAQADKAVVAEPADRVAVDKAALVVKAVAVERPLADKVEPADKAARAVKAVAVERPLVDKAGPADKAVVGKAEPAGKAAEPRIASKSLPCCDRCSARSSPWT